MKRSFYVEWHTEPSPGAEYYHGVQKVDAESMETASDIAQTRVWQSFKGYSRNHIVIDGVSTRLSVRRDDDER